MYAPAIPPAWTVLQQAFSTESSVECRVTGVVAGGLLVEVSGLPAFMPQSKIELGTPHELSSYLGLMLRCHILQMNVARFSIVVGRIHYLKSIKQYRQDKALQTIQPGDLLEGVVKKLVHYGAFVELNGIDGLIRNNQLAWGRCQHPSEHVHAGEKVTVKVLSINCVDRHIELSLRDALPDPWTRVEHWPIGQHCVGIISNKVDYGYFVRLFDGVEGLLHINNMGANQPSLSINDSVELIVLGMDFAKKRISLGISS